jgi:AcrR family transcriptional regulator
VLAATMVELAASGYGRLRVEDVAARAGVNKTTIYRRWPAKEDLVAAALTERIGEEDELPDTGTVRGDLAALVRRTVAFLERPDGRAVARLLTVEAGDPEVDRIARRLRAEVSERRLEPIRRAIARGELPPDVDARLVTDAVFAPVTMRLMRFGERVDDATIARLVDLAIRGVEGGGGRRI